MCGICGCSNPSGTGKFSVVDASKVSLLTTHHHNHGNEQHSQADNQRLIQVELDLLSKNNAYAAENRTYFQNNKIFVLNLVSSPGAGKTTLLVETIKVLKEE